MAPFRSVLFLPVFTYFSLFLLVNQHFIAPWLPLLVSPSFHFPALLYFTHFIAFIFVSLLLLVFVLFTFHNIISAILNPISFTDVLFFPITNSPTFGGSICFWALTVSTFLLVLSYRALLWSILIYNNFFLLPICSKLIYSDDQVNRFV